VVHHFENAEAKGLRSVDYDGGKWSTRLTNLQGDATLARFDVAVTVALVRYLSDISAGRVNPSKVDFALDVDARIPWLPAIVWQASEAANTAAVIASVEPQHDEYRRLIAALATYRRIAAESANDAPLPVVTKLVVGDTYEALPQLATRLRRTGDLAANAVVEGNVYTGAIVDAVKHFQSRHGLDADGVISKRTFTQLNVPASERVKQIEWSIERWRWTPARAEGPSIYVNIPEFRLYATDGQSELTMRVVVGKADGHKTPVMEADMKHVVFRPSWYVPPSIQRGEIAPKANATYLAKHNYELVDNSGRALPVTDDTLRRLRTGSVSVRQKPGTSNALGLVKFLFPNDNNVYLHSTPAQSLFARTRRDFSHGCVRVEDPVALAAWTLRDQPQWTKEKIEKAMNGDRGDVYVKPAKPINVTIMYVTAAARGNDIYFFDDIYGHDTRLAAAFNGTPAKEKVLVAQMAP
jgi:murein L,D-transpeptidase YcbB/YkuD